MPVLEDREVLQQRYGLSGKIEAEISFQLSIRCESLKALNKAYPNLNRDTALKAVMQIGIYRAKNLGTANLQDLIDTVEREANRRDCLCEVVKVRYPMVEKEVTAFQLMRERLQINDEQTGLVCLMLGLRQIEGRL